jgi:polyhydroxyalkanoate synthesis regulator phasin
MNDIPLYSLYAVLEERNAHSIGLLIDLLVENGRLNSDKGTVTYSELTDSINRFIEKVKEQLTVIDEEFGVPLF